MPQLTQHISEWNFTIVADPEEDYYVEFKIYDVVGYELDNESDCGQSTSVYRTIEDPYRKYTQKLEEAEIFLKGTVKWDGCSNWLFPDECVHGCSREDLSRIGEVMAYCYDWTDRLIGIG